MWDDEERRLLPAGCWYISPKNAEKYQEFVDALAGAEFETGIGVPGRVYESGAPLWIEDLWMEDLSKDEFFKSRKVRAEGMQQSVLGLPILVNGHVRFILEFFDEFKNKKDNVFLQMFQEQGTEMISRVFERKFAEADLADYAKALAISNRELDEFAFVASHDLKAPLRVIDNASKWLEEDLQEHLNDDMRESMGLLRGRVKRMDKLLDENEMMSGVSLMENVLGLLSPPAGFTVRASPAFSGIHIHRMPLQQILINLLGNAIKHHDKPSGSVDVSVENKGAFYEFSVKDDGPGIAPQFHTKIFQMFQTLKPRDQVEGSGIGLAIVRKHIEVLGGTIEVDSDVGKGTIFRFTLPKSNKKLS
jgi:signal transduction histidine kinase